MSKLLSDLRLPHPFSSWIGVTALVLGACSGIPADYTSSLAPSPSFERPLIEARRCLETLGFDMKIIDVRGGLISGEKFELADDASPTFIVSEVSVLSGGDSVRIIGRSRRASPASEGWESVGVTESVRRTVDRLADHLDGSRSRARAHCRPILTYERDEPGLHSRPHRRLHAGEGGFRAADLNGATVVREEYYCDFGLNPDHQEELQAAGLRLVRRDEDDEARVLELPGHPFFVATLFVPPLRFTPEDPHPLVRALLPAAADAGMEASLSIPQSGE